MHPRNALSVAERGVLMAWEAFRGRRGMVAGAGVAAEIPGAPVLPFSGGWLDQPEGLARAFALMDDAAARTRAAQQDED